MLALSRLHDGRRRRNCRVRARRVGGRPRGAGRLGVHRRRHPGRHHAARHGVGRALRPRRPGSENKGPNANFSFQYIDQSSVLIVTHDRGDSFDAGNLSIRSQGTTVTWAALANTNDTAVVGPGATVQLSRRNAFGSPVSASGKARVLYKPPTGNETVLETWKGIG
ncbi:hypothetical protein ACFQL4_12145 [Halosimplex aquaticum]